MDNRILQNGIKTVASRLGWEVSVTALGGDVFYYDFQRRTKGGLPFNFTVELSGGEIGRLIDEIISFVDALDPERYARIWLDVSGKVSFSDYVQAVMDMDDVRSSAWLIAFDLSIAFQKSALLTDFPWFAWN